MYRLETGANRAEALALIKQQQMDPATSTFYLDGSAYAEAELDLLTPPWESTLRVMRDENGELAGAVVIEIDPETRRAWVYGPWTTPDAWQLIAPQLVEAAIDQCPEGVDDWELAADVANEKMRWLAEQLGWPESPLYFNYTAPTELLRAGPSDPRWIRPATGGDFEVLKVMHHKAYPATYLTARQMMMPARLTLVAVDDRDTPVGYISCHEMQTGEGGVDFLSVLPEHRRKGLGKALIRAAARRLDVRGLYLNSTDSHQHMWAMFSGMGFRLESAFRSYRRSSPTRCACGENGLFPLHSCA